MSPFSEPPPPPPAADDAALWRSMSPFLAVIALVTTLVMTMSWLGARADARDARAERDVALADVDASQVVDTDLQDELERVRGELIETQTSLVDAEAQLAGAGDTPDADVVALERELSDLQTEVDRLARENADLTTDLDAATATADDDTDPAVGAEPAVDAEPADDTAPEDDTTPEDDTAPEVVVDVTPPTFLEIGTTLGGLYRENVLGQGQRTCLGEFAAGRLGDDLGEILALDDPGADGRLVETLNDAAPVCRISPSAIFG